MNKGLQFLHKNKLKSGIFNYKKNYKQTFFSLSELRIQIETPGFIDFVEVGVERDRCINKNKQTLLMVVF